MKSFLEEFKAFAVKGNVVDLAVAVVIGAAFGKIVSSLVDAIIMPLIGTILGGVDFSDLSYNIGETAIAYGSFIQAVVDFVIIAFVIFVVIRAIRRSEDKVNTKGREGTLGHNKEEEEKIPEPSEEVVLLREIRDGIRKL